MVLGGEKARLWERCATEMFGAGGERQSEEETELHTTLEILTVGWLIGRLRVLVGFSKEDEAANAIK